MSQELCLSFPEGWVPSAENGGSYAEPHRQLGRTTALFVYWLSFAAEPSFDFDVDEPGSRRGAEGQAEEDAPHV